MSEAHSGHGMGEDEPPLGEFLCHVHHGRWIAARTFAAVFAFSLFIAALIPPSYKATASVTILPAPEYTERPEAGSAGLTNTVLDMDQMLQTESEILQSDDLHEAVLRRIGPGAVYEELDPAFEPGVAVRVLRPIVHLVLAPWRHPARDREAEKMERALARFSSHLTILPSKDGNVIAASFSHPDPTVAALVLNGLIEAYAVRRNKVYTDPQLETVRAQAAAGGRAVAAAETALADFKRLHDISDAAAQRGLLLHRRSDAEQARADAAGSASEQQARLDTLASQLKSEPVTVGLYQEHDPDTRVQTLLASLQDLRGRLAAAHGRYLDSSRLVSDLRGQIQARESELRQLARDPSASIVRTGRNPDVDQLRLDRAHAAADHAAAVARGEAASAEITRISAALSALDANEITLAALARRVTLETDALVADSRILASRRLTEAEDELRFTKVRVIQPARVPQRPRPLPVLIVIAGFLAALMAAAARVVARYMLHQTFFTAEGVEAVCGLDVLAVFPETLPERKLSMA